MGYGDAHRLMLMQGAGIAFHFRHTRMLSSCTTPMTSQAIVSYFSNLKPINFHAIHEREPWI